MPRKSRTKSSINIYHVILRGVNKQVIFEEIIDYIEFLGILSVFKKECGYKIFAYCLMSNHVHLLIKCDDVSVSNTMRKIEMTYVKWFNKKYQRCGNLFQDRFRSEPVEDVQYLLTVFRYIHQNPLKAGLETGLGAYKWSSFHDYNTNKSQLVDVEKMLFYFDNNSHKCLEFLRTTNNDECLDYDSRQRNTDGYARKVIYDISGCRSAAEFQRLDIITRNECLRKIKLYKINDLQITRLTGVSKRVLIKI